MPSDVMRSPFLFSFPRCKGAAGGGLQHYPLISSALLGFGRTAINRASCQPDEGNRAGRRGNPTGKPLRVKTNLLNGFNLIWVVQLSSQIYTSSLSPQISGYFRAVLSRQEG